MGGKFLKLVLIVFVLFLGAGVFGYDNLKTHPLLTDSAVSLYNQTAPRMITGQQTAWIIKGSIDEDADPRYLNHFYDPTTGRGLNGTDKVRSLIVNVRGVPAKAWAQQQSSNTGDYSEAAILKNYRQGNLTRAYQGIGHILHLIQDMAVPAHTRNDPHAAGDPYEKWAESYGKINLNKLENILISSTDQAFDELSDFTNKYFFSKDTTYLSNLNDYEIIVERNNNINVKYLTNIVNGKVYKLCKLDDSSLRILCKIVDDDLKLNMDYWNLLYPKAVGYSAGVIEYFVKKFEQIDLEKKEEQELSAWQKLKNNLANIKNQAQYAWGDVFMSQRIAMSQAYDKVVAMAVKTESGVENFADANKEIVLETTDQAAEALERAGQVLSAKETAPEAEGPDAAGDPAPAQTSESGQSQAESEGESASESAPSQEKTLTPESAEEETGEAAPETKIISPPAQAPTVQAPIIAAGDLKAPETTITSAPASLASSTAAEFIFIASEANSTFECDLDGAGWQACASPRNLTALTQGEHIFKVRASDAAANIDDTPAEAVWRVDTIAPEITISSGPPDPASSTEAVFEFSASEAGAAYRCRLDSADWQSCSASTTAVSLSEGRHNFAVMGIDAAGNTGSSTEKNWLVDLTAPTSTVDGLATSYETTGFIVSWSGADLDAAGATTSASGLNNFDLEYQLDSAGWQAWLAATTSTSSAFSLAAENNQTVSFRSRLSDLAGNVENWPDSADASTTIKSVSEPVYDHLVISEIQTVGAVHNDEFIEIYNPTGSDISLSGYSLQYRGSSALNFYKKDFRSGSVIKAKSYYLASSYYYDGKVTADLTYSSFNLSATGGTVFLVNGAGPLTDATATSSIVADRLAYGAGDFLFAEGAPAPAPPAHGSLERKAFATSTAETMALNGAHDSYGNKYDSNNNAEDFISRGASDPNGPYIFDIVRDDVDRGSNFVRDNTFTNFKPSISPISGISIKSSSDRAVGSITVTLCHGIITGGNMTSKVNCGTDTIITKKTCVNVEEINVWQNCSFDQTYQLIPGDEYYVIVNGTWVGTGVSNTNYNAHACGFNAGGVDWYCFSNAYNGFLTFRTYNYSYAP